MRIDMEATRPAEQPAPVDGEPGFEPINFHGAAVWSKARIFRSEAV
jgi:hypothetical protein